MKILILNCVESSTLLLFRNVSLQRKKTTNHKTCQIKWSGKLNACLNQTFSEDHISSSFLALPF